MQELVLKMNGEEYHTSTVNTAIQHDRIRLSCPGNIKKDSHPLALHPTRKTSTIKFFLKKPCQMSCVNVITPMDFIYFNDDFNSPMCPKEYKKHAAFSPNPKGNRFTPLKLQQVFDSRNDITCTKSFFLTSIT